MDSPTDIGHIAVEDSSLHRKDPHVMRAMLARRLAKLILANFEPVDTQHLTMDVFKESLDLVASRQERDARSRDYEAESLRRSINALRTEAKERA